MGFSGGSSGKESTWQCRRHKRCGFNSWVGKIPWSRERLPTPVFWSGEFHGLYSPWGRKESDTSDYLSLTRDSLAAQRIKSLPAVWETWVPSLDGEDPPGEGNGNPL